MARAQRRTTKDISDTLGKLPPQAPELERSVLGALLTETSAIGGVARFLTVDHFYIESHRLIYQGILSLHSSGHPVDLKTVVVQLRRTGHLEAVGGATYLSTLSNEVSSAAHLEYHARVVIELALKRQLITLASRIHQKGYEDDADVFEMIEAVQGQLTALTAGITPSVAEQLTVLWEKVAVIDKPPPRVSLITLSGVPLCTRGNHSMVSGKKKARKSLFVVHLLSLAIQQKQIQPAQILCFDTEQERADVYAMREKVYRLTGAWITFFTLRGMHHKDRQSFIEGTCNNWATPPVLVVIDGVRDLMADINDMHETMAVIGLIERLTVEKDLHIIDVLHLNKTDQNARGNIGTELLNKSEMNIELAYDESSSYTEVRCESARRHSFPPFMFTHGPDGLPEVIGEKLGEHAAQEEDQKAALTIIFEDGPLRYKALIDSLREQFAISDYKARQLLAKFQRGGWIIKNGAHRDPATVYKLLLTPQPQPPADPSLFPSNGTTEKHPENTPEKPPF